MSKRKIAVLVSGGGSNLQALLDAVDGGIIKAEVKLVLSDRPSAYALKRAAQRNIPALCIDREEFKNKADFNTKLLAALRQMEPDLIILAGFLSILSEELVKQYQGRIINIHPSLIPDFCGKGYYGDRVHRAVIEAGAKQSGATVHFVDENTDTGPIILQQAVEVLPEDTPEALAHRVLDVEHRLIVEAAALYCEDRLKLEGRNVIILGGGIS